MDAIGLGGDPDPGGLPEGPDFFEYAEETHCNQVLAEVGFTQVLVRHEQLRFPVDDGVQGLVRFITAGVRTKALYDAQTGEAKARIGESMLELMRPYESRNRVVLPAHIVVVSATKG